RPHRSRLLSPYTTLFRSVDAEEGRDRDVGRSDVPAHVPRIGRAKEDLAIVGSKPELQSAVDAAGFDVGLPDFSPASGIEPEQPRSEEPTSELQSRVDIVS